MQVEQRKKERLTFLQLKEKDNMEYSIEVKHLKKYYGNFLAVDDVSFNVAKGSLFAFLGMNGAGKSTTINIICSILSNDEGEVFVNGKELHSNRDEIKHQIGVVFQNSVLDASLSVYDNLRIRTSFYKMSKEEAQKNMNEIISLLDLEPILKKPIKSLSGGQKRKVDIARAMIHKPNILILDEPTTGLDPKTRKIVWSLINKIREETGMTVFLTTHYLEEAEQAMNVVIMNRGKIIAEGLPVDLKNKYSHDHILAYMKRDEKFEKLMDKNKHKYSYDEELVCYDINVEKAANPLDLLENYKDFIKDFEVKKGTMEDVFLLVTGENFEEGESHE